MTISIDIIVSAFAIGFAGSLHCLGMCGPLALSLPISHNNNFSRITGAALYNTGRILSYTILGIVFGSLGGLIIAPVWQSSLSLALGFIILFYLVIPKRYFHFSAANKINKPFLLLRRHLGNLFHSKKQSSVFVIGLLNGFLPCGLVYLALSSSVIAASSLHGGAFMLFFGLGTFPAMFAIVVLGNYLNQSIRLRLRKAVPVLLFFMATILVLRGMGLGIPFLSPSFTHVSTVAASCR
ncbi:MAG: sulfite exporter TauE/SafE family protein [Bacteroidetes bacterium]|nr:sulfite exporter TauE/SafE family protein [Bacteroidota bacterium]MBS1931215.1 sulfite exporter TauE/SafE family protein [Bacteroidota bacterium]